MKWKISIVAVAALLLFSGVSMAAATEAGDDYNAGITQARNCNNTSEQTQYQPVSDGNGTMQQNRTCYSAEERTRSQPVPGPTRLWQQFRNQICDMLGVCQGCTNLAELTGVFLYDGKNFFIGDVELHFGPYAYISTAISAFDYDNDTQLELIIDELLGLVNTTVIVEGHYQSDYWMSVFTINGDVYREPGQPIWVLQHEWNQRYRYGGNGQP